MIVAKQGLLAGARLRQEVSGLRRVIIARTDGLALYDDVPLEQRDGGAALTAAVVGLAATATAALGAGGVRASVTIGESGALVLAPVDAGHVLAVVVDADGRLGQVADAVVAEAERLRALSGTVVRSA